MDPLSLTASLIAVIQLSGAVVSAVYNYRKDAKSAPEDAAKIVSELTALTQVLENILRATERERLDGTDQLPSVQQLTKAGGPLESCKKALNELNAKLQPENGWRAVRQKLVWPLKQDQVNKTLAEIASVKATLNLALTADQATLAIATKAGVDALAASFQASKIDESRKDYLSKISSTNPTSNHQIARKKHQEGTGEWFLKSKQYVNWTETTDSLFWINGIRKFSLLNVAPPPPSAVVTNKKSAGSGKTILSSAIIEDILQNQQPQRTDVGVAYYYFNFQNKMEVQLINMLRSMIFQFAYQIKDEVGGVRSLSTESDVDFSVEYLEDILSTLLVCFDETFIVVDAIDECEQVEETLQWIQSLTNMKGGNFHLLVTSRQDHHFRSILEAISTSHVALDEETMKHDVRSYIESQLNNDPRLKRWPSAVKEDARDSLLLHSGHLFRWVECQLQVLRKCLRINGVKELLESPPKSLNETYERILADIDEMYVEDAFTILQWLCVAARPLKTIEINDALAFDRSNKEHPIFDPNLRLPLLEDVLDLCTSLISVSKTESTGQDETNVDILEVKLAHNSVKDFLLSSDIRKGSFQKFAVEAALAHTVIAQSCLAYLLQLPPDFGTSDQQLFPLANYAARFWTQHYKNAEVSDDSPTFRLALQLLEDQVAYHNCCTLNSPDEPWRYSRYRTKNVPPPLYYVCSTGLPQFIEPLMKGKVEPETKFYGCYFGAPISAASYRGDTECVRSLLKFGVLSDYEGLPGRYGSPLATAAAAGQDEVIELLLQAGADINYRGEDGEGEALFHAVEFRHIETVKTLLAAGANAAASSGMSGVAYAIDIAADRHDRDMVHLLFANLSDDLAGWHLENVAAQRKRKDFEDLLQTPKGKRIGLKYAARGGWYDIVSNMIAAHPPSNSAVSDIESETGKDGPISAALASAAKSGSLETVQIVYENIPHQEIRQKDIDEALSVAVYQGFILTVKYLIDRGGDVKSEVCQDALFDAVRRGHISTVQIMLSTGSDPNWRNQPSRYRDQPYLFAAVESKHVEMTRLLLKAGADPNRKFDSFMSIANTVLHESIKNASDELFDILLDHGAIRTNVKLSYEPRYDSIGLLVHLAARSGSVHILKRLLSSGLEANEALVPDGWTALFHAARQGHSNIVSCLVDEYAVDVNQRANKGTLAIHTAAYHNRVECIEFFLDSGVDVNVRGRLGRTALHWATDQCAIDAVRVLLARGADITLEEQEASMTAADMIKQKIVEAKEMKERAGDGAFLIIPYEDKFQPILAMLGEQDEFLAHAD